MRPRITRDLICGIALAATVACAGEAEEDRAQGRPLRWVSHKLDDPRSVKVQYVDSACPSRETPRVEYTRTEIRISILSVPIGPTPTYDCVGSGRIAEITVPLREDRAGRSIVPG